MKWKVNIIANSINVKHESKASGSSRQRENSKKRSWKFTTIEHVEHTFYIIFRDSNVSNSKHIFFFLGWANRNFFFWCNPLLACLKHLNFYWLKDKFYHLKRNNMKFPPQTSCEKVSWQWKKLYRANKPEKKLTFLSQNKLELTFLIKSGKNINKEKIKQRRSGENSKVDGICHAHSTALCCTGERLV